MSALTTLRSWELFCAFGASNVLKIGDTTYTWDTRPREQKNGSLVGRVYAQVRGELPKDVGSYKILADGSVSEMPAPLAEKLVAPILQEGGGRTAGSSIDDESRLLGLEADSAKSGCREVKTGRIDAQTNWPFAGAA